MRHAIFKLIAIIICISFALPLLISLLAPTQPESPSNVALQHGLEQLDVIGRRLEDANSLNRNYRTELTHLKRQLEVFLVMQSGTDNTPTKSSIVAFLPHLSAHLDALIPATHYAPASRKAVSFVIGITHVKYDSQDHLIETLKSVIDGLAENDVTDTVIVLLVGESDEEYVSSVVSNIKSNFGSAVSSGLIEVISPKKYYYPDMSQLKLTFGDSLERVQWRTKQVLDFSYLMMFCRTKGVYFLQIPDDVTVKKGFIDKIRQYLLDQHSNEWYVLDFAPDTIGIVGKLMRSLDLTALSEFFLMFHSDKPADWLLEDFLSVKFCNPEKSQEDCSHEKDAARRKYRPALFTQIGVTPAPKPKNDKKPRLFIPHENPPAVATTTLTQYQDFRIDIAYAGDNYFWAFMPKVNDTVSFEMTPPVRLKEFYFRSGNADHIDDRFYDTIVEVKFEADGDLVPSMFKDKQSNIKIIPGYPFAIVGSFDNNGIAEGAIPSDYPVNTLRLRSEKESTFWVALSEIKLTAA